MKDNKITIGLSGLIDFRSNLGQEIMSGINDACEKYKINLLNFISIYRLSVKDDIENYIHYRKTLKYLNRTNIDGLISITSSLQNFLNKDEIQNFHQNLLPLPIISIGLPLKNIKSLLNDNKSGIREIMKHLIKIYKYKKIRFYRMQRAYSV